MIGKKTKTKTKPDDLPKCFAMPCAIFTAKNKAGINSTRATASAPTLAFEPSLTSLLAAISKYKTAPHQPGLPLTSAIVQPL